MNTFRSQLFTAPLGSQRYDLRVGTRAWTTSRINLSICILGHTCVGHTPIHHTPRNIWHTCVDDMATLWSQRTIWYTCGRPSVRQATTQHLVHMCGRIADPPGHNSAFGTRVWTTRRFTRSQITIGYTCVGDNSNCKAGERTCGVRNKVGGISH